MWLGRVQEVAQGSWVDGGNQAEVEELQADTQPL